MMQLSDFSSLFELIATINLAFIAVNYLNDYSNVLANRVFQIEAFIESHFGTILSKVEELNGKILNISFQNEQLSHQLTKVTRTGETHIASLDQKSKEATDEVFRKCYFKTFSSTCLWSFLFCCLILFISGYESINRVYINNLNIQTVALIFSLFSYTFFILCWGWSDTKCKFLYKVINKLSYVLVTCIVCFILSIIISININLGTFLDNYFVYLILLPILTPCVNFIISICPTFYKISRIKRETIKYIEEFENNEVTEHQKEVDTILKAKEWNIDIVEANTTGLTFDIRGFRHIASEGLERIKSLTANAALELIADPNNPTDPNAIAIHTKNDNVRIGYVPKELTIKFRNRDNTLKKTNSFTSTVNYSYGKGFEIEAIAYFE